MSNVIVCWPESQELSEYSGFFDNCELLNTPKQIAKYGSCAYRVDKEWYDMLKNGELEEMTEEEWEENEGWDD